MAFVVDHWLAVLCLLAASAFGAIAIIHWHRRGVWPWVAYLPAAILASYGVGAFGFLEPWWLGQALAVTACCGFVRMLAAVLRAGWWSAPLAYALTTAFFIGLGDVSGAATSESLRIAGLFLISLRPQEPWWLLLFLFVPV